MTTIKEIARRAENAEYSGWLAINDIRFLLDTIAQRDKEIAWFEKDIPFQTNRLRAERRRPRGAGEVR